MIKNVNIFTVQINKMRSENLGRTFERRELELLALKYGIYFAGTMWTVGLGDLLMKAKIGMKYVYFFKNTAITVNEVEELKRKIFVYEHDRERKLAVLRKHCEHLGIVPNF